MAKEQLPPVTRERIEKILSEHDNVLFMKGMKSMPQCGFSARVVQILTHFGADFHVVNVLADPEIREGIKVYADWPTIPQLYHKGSFLGGCDIVSSMAEKGQLPEALELGPPA